MLQPTLFFIKEAFIGIRRSFLMSTVSMMTVTIAMIVFGFFLLLSINLNSFSSLMASKLEIRVFLKNTLTVQEIHAFEKKLTGVKGIKVIQFIAKEDAWQSFQKNFQALNLAETIRDNPLPHSFRISLFKDFSLNTTVNSLKGFDYYVDEVVYGGEIASRIEKFSMATKAGGMMLVSLLGVATLLIIVNTIRLTVLARQEEIAIMRLVGATDTFIKGPFIIEGFLIGSFGGGAAILCLFFGYGFIVEKLQSSLPFFPIIFNPDQIQSIYVILAIVGTMIGIFGAYLSVSKCLKREVR